MITSRGLRRAWLALMATGLWLCAVAGQAQAQGAAAVDAAAAGRAGVETGGVGYAGGELGFGQVDEDVFITLSLTAGFRFEVPKLFCLGFGQDDELAQEDEGLCRTTLGTGVRIPLRLRVFDDKPEDAGVIRSEDWDNLSDFARIVRYVEYGQRPDPVYARLGEFNGASLGHGTVMNRYFNVLHVDHFQLGLNTNLNANIGGVELVMDNLFDPEVMGYRLYVRPTRFTPGRSFWDSYAIGTTLLVDVSAPLDFRRVAVEQDPFQPFEVTDDGRLIPIKTRGTGVLGIDQELLLVSTELVDFIPYLDLNFHLGNSLGSHLGTMTNLRPSDSLGIYTKLELRWLGRNHLPVYFGPIYEIERESFFAFGSRGQPKLVALESLDRGAVLGAYAEATFDISGHLTLTGSYEDYQGPDNATLLLRAQVPNLGPVSLTALYQNSGFDNFDGIFNLDNALLVAEARYNLNPFIYLLGQYNRLWRLQDDGEYETVNDWQLGAGAAIGF